ncbi:hypothetical protein CJ739_987 [Mariniflexile rhizosphaerae]|uniref:DUF6443 domain-containing protein n=1 Tax=unclassified Mariniflexile TaxID=2643887 RepID=UPI000E331BE7|nr:DUF6443 domain-containing protein [Mariniflexile sp. TRM1-10]AXP80080.1 hypothetical protein CJ739_987 [Mariniflexile sp. TRM1-10]
MKKLLYTLATVLVPSLALAQTTTENYIKNTTYQVETTTGSVAPDEKIETITYFDGLGRPKQSIAKQAGGNKQDIITPVVYDAFGRQVKDYLPYADPNQTSGANLGYREQDAFFFTAINTRYLAKFPGDLNTGLPNPFSEKRLESSPLSRVMEQGAPGTAWALNETVDTDPNNDDSDHTIKFGYATNTEYDYVRRFEVSFPTGNTEAPQLVDAGYYLASQLYKTTTKDENWRSSQVNFTEHTTEEYKDKLGRVVLKRTFYRQKWLDTYYVYDDYGNLTYVLPPKAVTLNTVPNPYSGDLGFYGDISSMLLTGGGSAEYTIWDTDDGFSVAIEIIGFTEGTALKSGKIADLDFSPYAPPLIDAVLGNIVSKDSNGNGNIVATVYTKDGDLYLNSTGAGLYTPNGSGNYYETMYADLSNYVANTIGAATLNGLCYQYRYDKRNRLVEKKIPGKGWEYIIYNKLDRPVMTQDSIQRLKKEWLFTKYDAFGRVAYTGLHTQSTVVSRATMQSNSNNNSAMFVTKTGSANSLAGTNVYYTNDAIPVGISKVYTINYYDDYGFDGFLPIPQFIDGQEVINYNNNDKPKTKGLATGSKVRVLDTNNWITTVTGYDAKGRAIYVKSVNDYLVTIDIIENTLDFVGKVDKTLTSHVRGATSVITEDLFTYDHMGRLKTQTQELNNTNVLEAIVENHYDELGQLDNKGVGGKSTQGRLQTVDYTYNIRGWLKQINDPATLGNDLFTFKLSYNTPTHGVPALYNGNISETEWRTANTDNTLKWYRYSYDALNRLNSGNDNAGNYMEYISYDKNGNINTLYRRGFNEINSTYGVIDILAYTYAADSNQLASVKDNASTINNIKTFGFNDGNTTGNDYAYDTNGNMVSDLNKGVTSVLYNHLNMPTKITVTGTNAGVLDYKYSADGTKLQKIKTQGGNVTTTDYAGNFVYENNVLKQFNQPEGYVEPDGSGYQYVYRLTDIWGNTRITFADDDNSGSVNSSEIRLEQNYYPFGMEHKGYNGGMYGAKNNLKTYQKQEFTEDLELNTHEWRYRVSDPAIGRFWQIDPLAEDYVYNSTYAFQENKMGMGTELEGLELKEFIFNDTGKGKPVLTLGLHHIKLPTINRMEGGGIIGFVENGLRSAWNGIAGTWNAGMDGANMGDITTEGFNEMGKMADRIVEGKGTVQDAENLTGIVITAAVIVKATSSKTISTNESTSVIDKAYKRPNNATTPAQRASVQGTPCVDCGGTSKPMVANHITPLVEEYYTTGTIDKVKMRSLEAVNSQCTNCSTSQGGQMSAYSKAMKKTFNLE